MERRYFETQSSLILGLEGCVTLAIHNSLLNDSSPSLMSKCKWGIAAARFTHCGDSK